MNETFFIIIGSYTLGFYIVRESSQGKRPEFGFNLAIVLSFFVSVWMLESERVQVIMVICTAIIAAASFYFCTNSSMIATLKGNRGPETPPGDTPMPATYYKVLRKIYEVGKQLERHPSDYKEMNEEGLRNQILDTLEPLFEGSATGETFNKNGKTDILVRVGNKNILIAECKCWRGLNAYKDALTQLLGYLTFRDTEAALVIFVRGKHISSAIRTVERKTRTHENCKKIVDKVEESWFNYRFQLIGDPDIEIKIAVLLFHIPKE